jgi:hypothetical protein
MSIHPMFIAEYQQNAQFHLQVELIHDSMAEDVDFGARGHGEFRVRGSTKLIFRGDQKLSVDLVVAKYVSEKPSMLIIF